MERVIRSFNAQYTHNLIEKIQQGIENLGDLGNIINVVTVIIKYCKLDSSSSVLNVNIRYCSTSPRKCKTLKFSDVYENT